MRIIVFEWCMETKPVSFILCFVILNSEIETILEIIHFLMQFVSTTIRIKYYSKTLEPWNLGLIFFLNLDSRDVKASKT